MRSGIFPVLLLVISWPQISAQDSVQNKNKGRRPVFFSLELGGNGGLYSFNYERSLLNVTSSSQLSWCGGVSVVPIGTRFIISLPFSLNYWHACGVEAGTGQTLIISTGGKGGTVRGTVRLGYRKNRWRFAYTPFYSYLNNFQWEHWFGIGYRFVIKKKK